jgi:polyhydroxyalkanoate synthesis regulator phasin
VSTLIERLAEAGKLTRQEARDMLLDLKAQVEHNRRELEGRITRTVKTALDNLRLPSNAQVDRLRRAVERLAQRIAALERERKE